MKQPAGVLWVEELMVVETAWRGEKVRPVSAWRNEELTVLYWNKYGESRGQGRCAGYRILIVTALVFFSTITGTFG